MLIRLVLDCLERTRLPMGRGLFALVLAWAMSLSGTALAKGTPAGTVIGNQVQLQFSSQAVTGLQVSSNTVQFVVQELIDVAVQWLDASSVPIGSPDQAVPLTFRVVNLGNASENFRLERAALSSTGDFTPTVAGSWAVCSSKTDCSRVSRPVVRMPIPAMWRGVNDLSLNADGSATIYLVQ